ncbi:MFS transporter [Actinomadura sp. WMMB 499]|uniref:MFS transporter n=1 Tax=Actinomadura sp. WMMB 499 TaxID=1219491 RepID=UPI00159CFEA6|nr:MFS transporter [Actinomadura sp. WMMB 499]
MPKALSPLALLTEPSVAPLFFARLLSSVGVGFGQLALAWGVMDLGYGPGGLSIVLACNSAPALLLLFGGLAGDRFRRHHVLMTAEIITCLAWLGLGACFLAGEAPLQLLCALALSSGVATAMFLPTIRGIIADLLSRTGRSAGNALISQTRSIGLLTGLAASGFVVSILGPGWAASTRGALCAVSAVLLSRLDTTRWQNDRTRVLRDLRTGWREFTAHRWVWILTLQYTAVIMAMVCFTDIAGPIYMDDGNGGARAWGIITATDAVGALIGAFIGARWKPARLVLAAALLPAAGAIPMFLLATGIPWPLLAAAALIPGACQAVFYVLWTTALQNTFAPDVLARVNSWNMIAGYALMPLTLLVAGPLVKSIGPQSAALGAGLLTVAAAAVTLVALRAAPDKQTVAKQPPKEVQIHL